MLDFLRYIQFGGKELREMVDFLCDKIGLDIYGEHMEIGYEDELSGKTTLHQMCIRDRPITDDICKMVLECRAGEHGITAPGQFINIKIDGLFLRRPISICDWTETTVTVIYKVVGRGTELLKTYEPGRQLNALSALGNGFAPARAGQRPLLIGGGVGVPPLYGLCRNLIEAGARPTVILGFNTEREVFYKEEFEKLGAEVLVATADGSMGQKGFVTDALQSLKEPETFFYTCGPEPMLKALDKALAEGLEGEMSFEERMGCGFGACMGCSCETRYGAKRICKDGPVLERSEILW